MSFSLALTILTVILVHGLGHSLAAACVGIRFRRVRLTATGFRLMTPQAYPSYRAEAITALGGPLANILSAVLVPHLLPSYTAFVSLSLYLGLLNLLPLRGFDGGTILSCVLCARHPPIPSLLPGSAERVISAVSALVLFLLWMVSVYLLLRRGSALSLYAFCLQLFRTVFVEQRQEHRADF